MGMEPNPSPVTFFGTGAISFGSGDGSGFEFLGKIRFGLNDMVCIECM